MRAQYRISRRTNEGKVEAIVDSKPDRFGKRTRNWIFYESVVDALSGEYERGVRDALRAEWPLDPDIRERALEALLAEGEAE